MTPNPFQTAQAVFSPDPDDPRLEVVRFERDDQRVGTGYCYERYVEPSAHQQQRMEHVAAAGWLPRPGADTSGDVWEVEHRALGWDGLVPGMSGTATITNVTEHGADVTVTSEDGERLEHVGVTLTSGTTDGTMGQQLAHELRELGWDLAGDELTDGQVVRWIGGSVGGTLAPRPDEEMAVSPVAAANLEAPYQWPEEEGEHWNVATHNYRRPDLFRRDSLPQLCDELDFLEDQIKVWEAKETKLDQVDAAFWPGAFIGIALLLTNDKIAAYMDGLTGGGRIGTAIMALVFATGVWVILHYLALAAVRVNQGDCLPKLRKIRAMYRSRLRELEQ